MLCCFKNTRKNFVDVRGMVGVHLLENFSNDFRIANLPPTVVGK